MTHSSSTCIYCDQSDQTAPLFAFQYQGNTHYICPQHLPILIHQPNRLAEKLPGLELLKTSEGHHDH